MTRFFIGWKNGVGGVIKIMAKDSDNPLTTPNTNYGAFLFNSENAEIGYGSLTTSQSFSPRSLSYQSYFGEDYYYPQQGNAKFRVNSSYRGGGVSQFQSFYYGNAIWANRSAFHYMFEDDADYRHIWKMTQSDYPRSSDARTIACRSFPYSRIIPYRSNNRFSIRVLQQDGGGTPESEVGIINYFSDEAGRFPATYKVACYHLDLPVDNTAYPAVAPRAPVAGQKMVRIDPTTARMSKPGFHVDTATDAQCIFTSNKLPMKVIKTDVVTINAGAYKTISMGRTLANTTFIDYQVNRVDSDVWVPPWPDAGLSDIVAIRYRFSGTNLQLHNDGAVNCQVRYIVMAQDDLEPSTGTAKVFEAVGNGKIVLRRPGTAGSRLADTIIDSSLAYMPIVSQKYVPIGDFVASDTAKIGNRMHRITLSNPGGRWKPYVLAKLECRSRADPTQFYYMDPYAKQLDNTSAFAASTFLVRISGDAMITFYCSTDNRLEDAYRTGAPAVWKGYHWGWEPTGLRYYIFAIPTSL